LTSLLAADRLFAMRGESSSAPMRAPPRAAKNFRPDDPTQSFLLAPSLDDWLPQAHTARFITEVVDELLDLTVVYGGYMEAPGTPPYDPTMMLTFLLYAYSIGAIRTG
jgi:hypothetical protein